MSVDSLLKRIYAYISWGIRYQADSERDVDQTLEELGFRIPKTGGRRLFDIVIPAVLLVALIATPLLDDNGFRQPGDGVAGSLQV